MRENITVTLKLYKSEYPILFKMQKNELEKMILEIFNNGYKLYFPEDINKYELISTIKNEIKNEFNSLNIKEFENALNKLIGISSNSAKKGVFVENILEELFNKRYGDISFVRKSQTAHSGDAWLYLPNNTIIILESKNYTTTVNKDEIIKLQNDMITHHIKWGLFISFNSSIQGMKDVDIHMFVHNNENYCVVMISNLTSDIYKLDLGLQLIRKLITTFNNIDKFEWIAQDFNNSIKELNELITKNYHLRDAYYLMEKNIQLSLSNFHTLLRNYQYDIELKINQITNKIQTIENKDDSQLLINTYIDSKLLPLITRLVDITISKKWIIKSENNNWIIKNNDKNIASIVIQTKKISINIINNDLNINLHLGKDTENKTNLDIIKSI